MGKAGILEGGKGDMIPQCAFNEGTADEQNELTAAMFEGNDIAVLQEQWLRS
jgi:hypothetical protein